MSVRIIATKGRRNDCTQADLLIDGIEAEHLIADKALMDRTNKAKKSRNGEDSN